MSEYKKFMLRGKPRYLGPNKKFIKEENIPADVFIRLQNETIVSTEQPITDKNCIFCGVGGCKMTRFINLRTIYLCEEHYYAETIGKIAQRLRERELQNA